MFHFPFTLPICSDAKPGSAPKLLSAIPDENSVILTWSEAKDPLTYYLVAHGTTADSLEFGNPYIGGKGTTSYKVEKLSGGLSYYFRVRAGNGCMPGDFSNTLPVYVEGKIISEPAQGFSNLALGDATETQKEIVEVANQKETKENQVLNQKLKFIPLLVVILVIIVTRLIFKRITPF